MDAGIFAGVLFGTVVPLTIVVVLSFAALGVAVVLLKLALRAAFLTVAGAALRSRPRR